MYYLNGISSTFELLEVNFCLTWPSQRNWLAEKIKHFWEAGIKLLDESRGGKEHPKKVDIAHYAQKSFRCFLVKKRLQKCR